MNEENTTHPMGGESSENMEMLKKLGSGISEMMSHIPEGLRNFMPQLQAIEGFAQLINSFAEKSVHQNGEIPDATTVQYQGPDVRDATQDRQVTTGSF